MKLILDSQALERLLGGNEELTIGLRTDVANQFADKYLKSLVSSQLVATTGTQIEELVKREIFSGSIWSRTLSPKYQKIISDSVTAAIINLIKIEIKEALDTNHYKKLIDTFIEQESNRIVREWTGTNIEQRIQEAADKKIKEKLGL